MATREIKTALALDGETKLKDAIKNINKEYTVLKSEMGLVTAQFGKNNDSVEKLAAVNDVLNRQIDTQKSKVAELENGLSQAKSAYGENSNEAKNYEIQLNNNKATLAKLESELRDNEKAIEDQGKEAAQAADKIEDHAKETKQADKETGKWQDSLKTVGAALGGAFAASAKAAAVAVAAVTAATVAAVKGLADMTAETGVWADDLITLSNQTGIAQETLQGLEYASRFVDVSVEDMTKGMGRLVREMSAAQTAGEDYISTSDGMTIAIKDTNGNFKDSEQLFYEAVDALGAMEDETQREIAAQELFGRSYQDIMPLIKAGSESLREYTKEAEAMGYILSTEQIAKLGEYDDLMQKTDAQMGILKRQLVTNFLPAFQTVGQGLSEVMSEISTALADGFQPEDVKTIGTMISEKLLEGVKTFSQYIPAVVETVTTVLTEAVNLVVDLLPEILPVLLDGAFQLIQGILNAIKENVEPLAEMVVTVLTQLVQFFLDNMPLVIEIGIEILLALINGLVEAIPQLIPAIVSAIITITDTILRNLDKFISAAIQIILAIVQGLIAALPQLIKWLPKIVNSVVDAVVNNLPLIIDAAIEIILAIVQGLIENLPELIDAAIEIIGAIVVGLIKAIPELLLGVTQLNDALKEKFLSTDWKQLGKDIIGGIINGLVDMNSALKEAATNAANNALTSIKSKLGIKSPSRVFRDEVGLMMGEGIAIGLDKSSRDIDEAFANALPDLERQYDVAFAGESIAAKKRAAAQMQPAQPEPIDYDRLAEAMSRLSVNVDGRQFGRVVRQHA